MILLIDFFRTSKTGWKNCIRHNLSLNNFFIQEKLTKKESQFLGRGNFWKIDESHPTIRETEKRFDNKLIKLAKKLKSNLKKLPDYNPEGQGSELDVVAPSLLIPKENVLMKTSTKNNEEQNVSSTNLQLQNNLEKKNELIVMAEYFYDLNSEQQNCENEEKIGMSNF